MAQTQEMAPVADAQVGIRDRVANFIDQGVQAVSAYAHEARVTAKLAAGVVLSGLAIAACGGEQEATETTKQTGQNTPGVSSAEADKVCADIKLTNTAFLNYAEGKFVPRPVDVNTNQEAVDYTKDLFSKRGPLAGQSDPGSSSIVNALITKPLFSPDTNNDPRDTRTTFEATLKRLNDSMIGETVADELCKANYVALLGTEGFVTYKPNAVMKGKDYIVYRAIADKDGNIVNYKAEQLSPRETEGGIVLDMENANPLDIKQEDREGINRVIIRQSDGAILTEGTLPETGKKQKDRDDGKGGKDRTEQKAKSGKDTDRQRAQAGAEGDQTGTTNNRTGGGSKQDRGTGSGTQSTGNKGGGTQKGNQGCGNSGKANCGGGSGKKEGNDKGQAGAPGAGAAPAPAAPAPSGGGGGGPTGGGGAPEGGGGPSGGGGGGTPPAEGGGGSGGGGGGGGGEPEPPKGADPGVPAGAPGE